ncbi:PF07075 family protein [Leptospira yanagawae serovar Saopaulo str. Sao Paulo = ATCC 700523]|uniref:PF07075 family protein n=1 Tax=Leptospira yanagawae serovar Saopaulo str. Sao Paulo = ATCC 700523 TaxID=1249483 RepID=A0A5E8H8N0_9LEPT|nr:DUF1343 domain-containing protein [Leptospira yanagawae]EOQ87695.1 PF07075 family protein [Leptospira yanagawae serovar Saopaulo str. Sao Paulo = ATCC 700523]
MKFLKNIQKLSGCHAAILTNQSAFGYQGKYHFQTYSEIFDLKTIFLPEHGLFAELQDQVSGDELSYLFGNMQIVNLYGKEESSLVPPRDSLKNIDLVIIDIKDVGSRYYTFLTTAYYILEELSKLKKETGKAPIFLVIDSPNPIGTKVEGSPLDETYQSFVGVKSVLHRHGLTPGGLLSYYNETFSLHVDVVVVPVGVFHPKHIPSFLWVPPSPNIPTQNTCFVYPGMCLLEGTNLSEGRGTTKPFETFGAPYLLGKSKVELDKRMSNHQKGKFQLRNLRFLPTFHKHVGVICEGYQLMVTKPKQFHSLYFTLYFLKQLGELFPDQFSYLKGVYEFRSDRPAIELLVGDAFLLEYLDGKHSDSVLESYLSEKENDWLKAVKPYRY